MVVWDKSDIIQAVVGGIIVSVAMTIHFHMFGKTSSIGDNIKTIFKLDKSAGFFWKFCYLFGIITLPFIIWMTKGPTFYIGKQRFTMFDPNEYSIDALNIFGWVLAGLLIGFGSQLGYGDTVSHAQIGVPLGQPKSILFTVLFLVIGAIFSSLRASHPFLGKGTEFGYTYSNVWRWISLGIFCLLAITFLGIIVSNIRNSYYKNALATYGIGLIFGLGISMSSLTRISKIRGTLNIGKHWDPTALVAWLVIIVLNTITFNLSRRRGGPLTAEKLPVVDKTKLDGRTVVGAALFGLGLGLGGLDPLSGFLNFFTTTHALFWLIGLVGGQLIYDANQKARAKQLDDELREELMVEGAQ